ncbi:TWiK family of potassium channels protein 12 [Contarinia nasturtii]|uniref:TWiK family of potassium channels protein 12 n=1 Tax=Contarinia nasturtii TaxID=265458 RepID=UPI0012D41F5C|nr:TWiK family of potassium channels protein 12 [Contarinia nasturtii]
MNRQNRWSVRSNGSQSSLRSVNRKEKCKDFCRKTIAFMCTQVGVGGLIVAYALVGAASFISIETDEKQPNITYGEEVKQMRNEYASKLYKLALKNNGINETIWRNQMNEKLLDYQNFLVGMIKKGYDGRTLKQIWSFPAALMFCLSVFSMIGYGNLTPRTEWGKATTVIYATFGIPLYILYFLNIGKVLAKTFRWLYHKLHECSQETDGSMPNRKKIIVPSSACVWVMSVYILLGAGMFSYLESWDFKNAVYFCVTSLCKIGIGDYVPGTSINATIPFFTNPDTQSENHTKLIILFTYILFGMGLVAMCYQIAREDIRVKIKEITEDVELCMEDLRCRLAKCCNGSGREIENYHS